MSPVVFSLFLLFFFNDTATTEIYTLSLHDALPIYLVTISTCAPGVPPVSALNNPALDRKSTRLNSSHSQISYAVFCLKKKTKYPTPLQETNRSMLYVSLPIKKDHM